jgi:hypothetical protein
MLTVF